MPPADTPAFGSQEMAALFGLDPDIVYFNHGGFGVTPAPVRATQDVWRRQIETNPTAFFDRAHFTPLVRAAATRVARWLGGRGEGWVFVANATAGLNSVLRSLGLKAGDEVVVTDHGYNAVLQAALYESSAPGARVVTARLPWPDYSHDAALAAIEQAITPRTKLVIVDHITSPTALILPVARIAALCRARGVPLAVDGAHAPGQLRDLDVVALGADIYVGNLHKWAFVPRGCGVLWASPAWRERLHPTVISHGYGQGYTAEFDWQGTFDPTPLLCVESAFEFAERIGRARLVAWNYGLIEHAVPALCAALEVNEATPPDARAMMATIALPSRVSGTRDSTLAIKRRLREEHGLEAQIVPFQDRAWLRIAAAPYLSTDDFARLGVALRQAMA
ncbi:MAG: aminotransferase class V-fold PLP-dependent enzyme [Reyranellaceae bacterium]